MITHIAKWVGAAIRTLEIGASFTPTISFVIDIVRAATHIGGIHDLKKC
jgi:hypothetical protein